MYLQARQLSGEATAIKTEILLANASFSHREISDMTGKSELAIARAEGPDDFSNKKAKSTGDETVIEAINDLTRVMIACNLRGRNLRRCTANPAKLTLACAVFRTQVRKTPIDKSKGDFGMASNLDGGSVGECCPGSPRDLI